MSVGVLCVEQFNQSRACIFIVLVFILVLGACVTFLGRVTRPNLGWVQCVLTSKVTELYSSLFQDQSEVRKCLVKSTAGHYEEYTYL